MDNLKVLSQFLNKEDAEEVLKLTKNYDTYVANLKKKLNKLLAPVDYEVLTGIAFKKKANGDNINGNSI